MVNPESIEGCLVFCMFIARCQSIKVLLLLREVREFIEEMEFGADGWWRRYITVLAECFDIYALLAEVPDVGGYDLIVGIWHYRKGRPYSVLRV